MPLATEKVENLFKGELNEIDEFMDQIREVIDNNLEILRNSVENVQGEFSEVIREYNYLINRSKEMLNEALTSLESAAKGEKSLIYAAGESFLKLVGSGWNFVKAWYTKKTGMSAVISKIEEIKALRLEIIAEKVEQFKEVREDILPEIRKNIYRIFIVLNFLTNKSEQLAKRRLIRKENVVPLIKERIEDLLLLYLKTEMVDFLVYQLFCAFENALEGKLFLFNENITEDLLLVPKKVRDDIERYGWIKNPIVASIVSQSSIFGGK
ncbi:MAG: hypothetical protein ABGX27_08515 [Desulfurobacteriaceae bacterium]